MGYEVLDNRPRRDEPRPARPTSEARPGPDDVVVLDPADDCGREVPESPLRRLAVRVVATSRGPHRASLLAGVALAVGALVGGTVGGVAASGIAARSVQREQAVAENLSEQRVLAVVAYAADIIRYDGAGGRTALLDVRVTNAGPRSVKVMVTPAWIEALPGHPVVRQTGASPDAAPGTDLSVLMTVLAHCNDAYARAPTVPVRTLDGTVHAVPIRSGVGLLDLTTGCRH
jgi:hypothetical protein